MIYPFRCYECELGKNVDARPFRPPNAPTCPSCGEKMDRVYDCQIDTSNCKDADDIPAESRVARGLHDPGGARAARAEKRFQDHITERRKLLADGGNRGTIRQTHSVPADMYHGKIRQTGDKDYWKDPKNLAKHKSTKVD